MRVILLVSTFMASTMPAYANSVAVPEIDPLAGFAALAVIGSVGALIWERRRKTP